MAALGLLAGALTGGAAAAGSVRGEVKVFTDGGYVRLMFRLDEEVAATVRLTGPVMVINFKKPVDVAVDRMNASVPDLISAARRDPDGSAVRIALAQKVKFNTIAAGERFYVDLMPETWSGPVPGLPQEVLDELTRRALGAERELRRQNGRTKEWQPPTIRVRVASQPTFTRYVFEMPDGVNVVPDRAEGRFTLNFDQQIKWDLTDAKAALPTTLESIDAEPDFDSVAVKFMLNGQPSVRHFREDRSIVVDVGGGGAGAAPQSVDQIAAKLAGATDTGPAIAAPDTVPVKDAASPAAPAAAAPAANAPPPGKAAAIAPASPAAKAAELAPPVVPKVEAAAIVAPKLNQQAPKPPAAVTPAPPMPQADGVVVATLTQSGDSLRLHFPFAAPTPAAVFRRADTLWLVFDSPATIDIAGLANDPSKVIRRATFERAEGGAAIVRIHLERPRLASADTEGQAWIVNIGDSVSAPTRALVIARNILGKGRASIVIPFDDPARLHRLSDPVIGDRLMVVTAPAPARGFLKAQNFVELQALPSTHGVVLQPVADDVAAELSSDKITVSRPGGLAISSTALSPEQTVSGLRATTFDPQVWGYDREAPYTDRQAELIRTAAAAPDVRRQQARLNLARFYLAREMGAEAKAVLDVAQAEQGGGDDDVTGSILKAIADVMLERPDEALKVLAAPHVGQQQDAPLWRAVAQARQGKWSEAREGFKSAEAMMAVLPIELQRMVMQEALRASIEVHDFSGAARLVNELETVGVPHAQEPAVAVLAGRLYEGMGRIEDALAQYRSAATSRDRRASAQGRLREVALEFGNGNMPRETMIHELETLATIWRGDETETESLKRLASLYTQDGRYRDAFRVMRTALRTNPNSDMTRKIQDEAALTFDALFLDGKGDALPPVEALGLFYDYRELTPIGRRGDEMIRRLAGRLVAVDLLDQAAELLQHQVDHRLQGAGRAQVATKLATIYLMNRKPDHALATLQKTRSAELANELREQRLLLEARALADIGRHDLALELANSVDGREAIRLRADVLWKARRWREAAEQVELLYGERWRDFTPLTETERADILRAAIGYALGEEPISQARLRDKYAAKMVEGPDRRAFDIVSAPIGVRNAEFQAVASRVAGVDTLEAFLSDMRKRYPDQLLPAAAPAPPPAAAIPAVPAAPAAVTPPRPDNSTSAVPPPPVPAGEPLRPDPAPTGSIRTPRPRPVTASR
ncbi:MAG: tetratricopeptide repeat protein [Bradyrhizobium sp.]|nr:tetratricopeptide repeat protein [Bradyrhizobium sp.]